MMLKRTSISAVILAAALLLNAQVAFAARIYNFLPDTVRIRSSDSRELLLAASARSESINWHVSIGPHWVGVWIPGGAQLCYLSFGFHKEIVGGNYLVIGHQGHTITCSLCDSTHRQTYRDNEAAPSSMRARLDSNPSGRSGC